MTAMQQVSMQMSLDNIYLDFYLKSMISGLIESLTVTLFIATFRLL